MTEKVSESESTDESEAEMTAQGGVGGAKASLQLVSPRTTVLPC